MNPQPPSTPYLVLKYYYYVPLEDVTTFAEKHHLYCIRRGLRGRIKIAPEGINGTVSGKVAECHKYMAYLKADPRFKNIEFNISPAHTHVHEKLQVKCKSEIVRSDIFSPIDERNHTCGQEYIDAETFEKIRQQKDVVIIDVRSNYEHGLGKFKESTTFDIDNFRSFFKEAEQQRFDKSKKYIVVCTRGIKSVKGWQYLKQVHQLPHVQYLQGGILDYGQKTKGEGFEGVCYVFDKRLTLPIQQQQTTVISQCHQCKKPSFRMINCANPTCNSHVPMCESCSTTLEGGCSVPCQKHPQKRPYNGIGYYVKQKNGYNPYIGLHKKGAQCKG